MFTIRRVLPTLANTMSRNISLSSAVNRSSLARLDNSVLGLTNNIFREMDKEFERMRKRITNRFNFLTPENLSMQPEVSNWLSSPFLESEQEFLPSMVNTDKEGNRKFQLALNLKEFKPEEIKVKTVGQNLVVSAKTERKAEDDYYLREISQSYQLPNDLKIEDLKSWVNENGFLVCEAALPKLSEMQTEQKPIPIEHEKFTQLK